jgi:hypothetical protein
VAAGDFNGDGKQDVAISNGGDDTVYVLLGNGDGTFQVPEILYTQGISPDWIAAVRLRKNGPLDLAVTEGDSDSVEIFLGNGDGTFSPGVMFSLPRVPTFVLGTDINNDGNQDLVIGLVVDPATTEPQFVVLLGNGASGFSGAVTPPGITNPSESPWPTSWIAAGDVNNDGYIDLVTTLSGAFGITYINNSGTAFGPLPSFSPPGYPMVVELGDMDEDGCLDAVELSSFGLATIAKGTCDGNFTQGPAVASVGDIDPAVKLVDVNGDGHLDVVASSAYYGINPTGAGREGGYLVSVMDGDGKGGLTPARMYRGGTDEFSLAVGDFTGNGKPDIVTADSIENEASLFRNDGTGNFDDPQGETIGYLQGVTNAPIPNSPTEAADLNDDGKPDLLLVEDGIYGTDPSQLTAMLNDGTGRFLPPVRTAITVGDDVPYPEFTTGHFRNATTTDVVYMTKYTTNNIVAFFPGNGDGTFATPATLATLPDPRKLVAGDFNGDGKLDFAVLGTDNASTLSARMQEFDVFLGNGDGTFTHLPAQKFAVQNAGGPMQLFAVDLNHDGKLDLLIGNNENAGWTTDGDDLIEALGNGDGTFQTPTTLIAHFGAVAVADVNGDGYPDLIQDRDPSEDISQSVFYSPAATVYLGGPGGTFQQQPSYHLPGTAIVSVLPALVGDFNGDGIPDIAVRTLATNYAPLTGERLWILQGVGDGTFQRIGHLFQLQGQSTPTVGADFNGDGATDLVELTGYTSSFHTIPAAPAPALDIALDSNPIIGSSGSATVTLALPAASAEDVTLSASDPAVQLPATLHFDAGQQAGSFAFTLGSGFDASHALALYATLGSNTAVAYGNKPNSITTTGVAASLYLASDIANPVTADAVTPGETLSLQLHLQSEGGYHGTFSSFQCKGLPAGASCSFSSGSATLYAGGGAVVSFTLATSSSTPYGTYPVQITTTDGYFLASAPLQFGIGDFSLSAAPDTIPVGPTGIGFTTVTSKSTNGLSEYVVLGCDGLPTSSRCSPGSGFLSDGESGSLGVSSSATAPGDYPFQITGSTILVSHSISAVLRVGDFSASLDGTQATITPGQSATFHVTLSSINHYSSQITVFCSPPISSVSCSASPSPASLPDGGKETVQLTVSVAAASSSSAPPPTPSFPVSRLLWLWLGAGLLLLLLLRRRKRLATAALFLALASFAGCGGGGGAVGSPPSTGSSGGGSGGSSSAQTVSVPVTAAAADTASDTGNQKNVGTIVVTIPQ